MPEETIAQVHFSQARFHVVSYSYRHYAVYDGDELIAVTVYKRGAMAVAERLHSFSGGGISIGRQKKEKELYNPFH